MSRVFERNSNEKFYEDDYNEDELLDNDMYYDVAEEELSDDEESSEEWEKDEEDSTTVHLSFACDDCDYRWDDVVVDQREKIEREEYEMICPMCGSINITQI